MKNGRTVTRSLPRTFERIPVRQLSAISALVAAAAALRMGMNWLAYVMPIPTYGVLIKIGLSETLAFTCGFAFGPIQGFITGALIIIVSDIFTWAGIWTPFIAAIIGMLGFIGGILRRFRSNPSTIFLGASAVSLTLISELLQNLWFAWYMQAFYMPETPFIIVLGMTFVGGIKSAIVALINNIVLFITIVPRIVEVLRNVVMLDDASKEADLP